mgnify:CR=1 FL=1
MTNLTEGIHAGDLKHCAGVHVLQTRRSGQKQQIMIKAIAFNKDKLSIEPKQLKKKKRDRPKQRAKKLTN